MPIIDADTHVDESDETWEFLDDNDRKFKPITVIHQNEDDDKLTPRGHTRYWLIDGKLRVRRVRDFSATKTTEATNELVDVQARIRHMDRLGVDIQVIYPSLLHETQVAARPEVEFALCKAYNRWMASKWKQGNGRIRWVAPLPLLSMHRVIDELRFVKDHGACGVLKRGRECGNRRASDPYFFPLYEEAGRLDIPICIHVGTGDPDLTNVMETPSNEFLGIILPPLDAFEGLVTNKVPRLFPRLRWGFIEATASWVPYLLMELMRGNERKSRGRMEPHELLAAHNFYVSCDTFDDLPYIISRVGDDNLVIGSDYGHSDMASEIDALTILREKADQGVISKQTADKILDSNPRALYAL
jgi:predicted TIM-barrel fold metal-dependent hydrolase